MHSDHDSSSGRTSAAHSPRQPTATWNPARDAWEVQTTGLFCEHSDVFSETFPSSGMTRGGRLYVLPTWEQRTGGSVSSSSRGPLMATPRAQHGEERNQNIYPRDLSQPQNLENQLARLPTPPDN